MASKAAEEPLKCKTWVLKVSIHCEGCKKKVKKVVQSIEGVYTTTIDSYQHKVTVTGNVEAEALIKKLAKTGKHAQLWPEKEKKQTKDAQPPPPPPPKSREDEETKVEEQPKPKKNPTTTPKPKQTRPPGENDNSNAEIKDPEKSPAETEGLTQPEKKEGESSNGGKKKGKKGQKSNPIPAEEGGGGVESVVLPSPGPGPVPVNINFSLPHPRQQVFEYPQYGPPHPVFGVSYNTVYPSNSSASYYAPARVSEPYMYQGGPPPFGMQQYHQGSSSSYEIFSEENANGCVIM